MKVIVIKGGLGNQMFQYALYLANKEKNLNVFLDLTYFNRNISHNGFELQKIYKLFDEFDEKKILNRNNLLKKIIFKIKKKLSLIKIYKDDFKYTEEVLKIAEDNIYYDGYWQSEKYFVDLKEKIKNTFIFPEILDEKNLMLLDKIKGKKSVSIHIRRGDYLGHPELDGLAPLKYYKRAIKYIKEKEKEKELIFLIFSNDIEWCKENLDFIKDEKIYIDWNTKENSFRDMQLMSLCNHNIIPNSSFSWWAAWLNKYPKKIVISPQKWFTNKSKLSDQDIIPNSWVKIKNY